MALTTLMGNLAAAGNLLAGGFTTPLKSNAPTSQKDKHIAFALVSPGAEKPLRWTQLPINPEELTRAEPSRVSAVNTLNGAWVDSFGRGLTTLTISGHTGWRDRGLVSGRGEKDGIERFIHLRDNYIHAWHQARDALIATGKDPSGVRLIFIDPLNGKYVADVAPTNFTLRRSKSQPLLLMYSITLTVITDKAVNPVPEAMNSFNPKTSIATALASMSGSIGILKSLQGSMSGALGKLGELGAMAGDLMKNAIPVIEMAQDIIKTANNAKQVIGAAGQIAVNLANDLSAVAKTVMGAINAVTSLPNSVKAEIMRAKGAFSNLQCILTNGMTGASSAAQPNYYGASNCSSTTGGREGSPFVSLNTFAATAAPVAGGAGIKVSSAATDAFNAIAKIDPLAPDVKSKLIAALPAIVQGVSWPKA